MERSVADSLYFLAPGFLHHLGNALFAAHGRMQLAAAGGFAHGDDRAAILGGIERAQHDLQLLRWLCGDSSPAGALRTLASLHEMLRVPLRDRGLAITLRAPASATAAMAVVEGAPFCRLLLAAVRRVAMLAVPGPSGGQLELQWDATDAEVRLWLRLQPPVGQPAYAFDPPSLLEHLAMELRGAAARAGEPVHACLSLVVPQRTGRAAAQA